MADRRRAAAAAATYDHVCHLLSVSTRSDCRSLVTHFKPNSQLFSTQKLCFSDPHALALSAALLVSHAASWPLVRRYLRTFVRHYIPHILPSFDALAISPFSSTHIQSARSSLSTPLDRQIPYTADFSFNSELTSHGAAAVLAACLLIPRPLRVDAFFKCCTQVSSLSMENWLPLLEAERQTPPYGGSRNIITGLCFDACPLRTIHSRTMSAFQNLAWVSLRNTKLSNLWRTAEMLDAIPSLVAALFSGSACDDDLLRVIGTYSHSHLNDSETQQTGIPRRNSFPAVPSGRTKSSGDHFQTATSQREMYSFMMNVPQTPVSLVPHYRTFLLAASRTALQFLDGEAISAQEREFSKRSFRKHFEQPLFSDPQPGSRSIGNLLKTREVGFLPRRAALKCSTPQRERPQKRRRTASPALPVIDIMAAVAAAGFPTTHDSSKLSNSTSLTVALAATASAQKTHREISQNLRKVREAALSIQKASERERLSMLASRWKEKPKRKLLMEGLTGYREDGFKRCMSTALINRRGSPHVKILSHGNNRPRQFEFNPANPSELVYGTEHGYLVVIDAMSGSVKGSCISGGGSANSSMRNARQRGFALEDWSESNSRNQTRNSNSQSGAVYGLSWLNTTRNLFISGVNSGAIHLYDVTRMGNGRDDGCRYACETFDRLTSIHVNSDDSRFAVSGTTMDVGLFDLETGKRLETMSDCHAESVNVIKFAHHSPHILLTSSFDRCVKKWDLRESRPGGGRRPIFTTVSRTDNVMACFSPDDSYLLVSAVDNEVRQYTACDGHLEREFRIPKRGSQYNFTRSYYMNDRDYIVTGSCQESVVRVYNARTGAFFTEVDMDSRETSRSMNCYVQTLRANPSRRFNFSAILASPADTANELIASVDLHSR